MITPRTQAAIELLKDIYAGEHFFSKNPPILSDAERMFLLKKLSAAGIIRSEDREHCDRLQAYRGVHSFSEVSLLDILEATGEHLDCNHPTSENFYLRYGLVARKLGVVNQMVRIYLKEIKLSEL